MNGSRHIAVLITALCLWTGGAMAQSSGLIRLTDRDDLFGWEAVGRSCTTKGAASALLIGVARRRRAASLRMFSTRVPPCGS
jgi:hypothetical protein